MESTQKGVVIAYVKAVLQRLFGRLLLLLLVVVVVVCLRVLRLLLLL
jgi:hypothetical protein